jgi:hypothetical protein
MEDNSDSSSRSVISEMSLSDRADSYSDIQSLLGPHGVSADIVPKDYWFGKKYFEYVLAQDILCSTRSEESASSVDV